MIDHDRCNQRNIAVECSFMMVWDLLNVIVKTASLFPSTKKKIEGINAKTTGRLLY